MNVYVPEDTKLSLHQSNSHDESRETLVLHELIALGAKQIEEGRFRSAEEVFLEMDCDGCCDIA